MTSLAKGFPFKKRFALRNHLLAGREWIGHGAGRFDLVAWYARAQDSWVSRPRQAPDKQEGPNRQRSN
jgi:hypothetical protein